jgi:hypothetical protein
MVRQRPIRGGLATVGNPNGYCGYEAIKALAAQLGKAAGTRSRQRAVEHDSQEVERR